MRRMRDRIARGSGCTNGAAWHETPQVIVRAATEPGLAERLSD
jgi:hypothetical protein